MNQNKSYENEQDNFIRDEQEKLSTNEEGNTTSLDLKYLVEAGQKKEISWLPWLFGLFILSVIASGIWMIYKQNSTKYIKHKYSGETLKNLAEYYYNDSKQWRKIFLANPKKCKKIYLVHKNGLPKERLSQIDFLFIPITETIRIKERN